MNFFIDLADDFYANDSTSKTLTCEVKLRYRSRSTKCSLTIQKGIGTIELQEPVYGVANGQIAVFYDDDKLIGGGVIIDRT
jgi:tRNA-specific 2-thiouridylase